MIGSLLYSAKRIGFSSADNSSRRREKQILNVVLLILMTLATIWGLLYLLLGLYISAIYALVFVLFSGSAFLVYTKTKNKDHVLRVVFPLLFALPFLIEIDLGGISNSGLMILWSILVPLGALLFKNQRQAIQWFIIFLICIVPFIYFDNEIVEFRMKTVPLAASRAFMTLNVFFSLSISFGTIFYYTNEANKERKKSFRLLELAYKHRKEMQKKNNELEHTIAEREILLKEIHHRVKNNMQVVTSLLGLQAGYISDEKTKALFRYSQYRIGSMAIVHEMLYQSKDIGRIKYSDYIKRLVTHLLTSMKGINHRVELEVDVPEIFLNIDTAIPLGLLINEIITNTLKYGIKGSDPGQLYVKIEKTGIRSYILKIGDNGPGFPEHRDFRSSDSLGILLMHNLALQLEGNIEKLNEPGTHYLISFNEIS